MKMKEKIQGTCVDLNHQGMGVVKVDGFPIFVDDMLIDEVAEIKIEKVGKSYAQGTVLKHLNYSTWRVRPICPVYEECGGCNLMHLKYEKQLEFKKKMAMETLKRIGHLENIPIREIIGMEEPYYYRNKVQIPFSMDTNQTICGFYKKKTHQIIRLEKCFIQSRLATEIAKYICQLANELIIPGYNEKDGRGILRHVLIRNNVNYQYMVVLVTREKNFAGKRELVDKLVAKFPAIKSVIQNINKESTNVILGKKSLVLNGIDQLTDTLCETKFQFSYNSFFQTNHLQTEKLYNRVLEYAALSGTEVVIDAYCGVGTIGILLAKKAKKVYGIEIVAEAVTKAIDNAKLNKMNNIEFICGKAEIEIEKFTNTAIDVIVLDPPRKGCETSLIEVIKAKKIRRVVYVSCNVATLARDLEIFSCDYLVREVTLIDMFPHTSEVECVCKLTNRAGN